MHRLMIATVALVAVAANSSAAQQSDRLVPGARVRVTSSAAGTRERHEGTLMAITPDSVTVGGRDSRIVSVPVRAVEKFELSLGDSHGASAKKGLKRGLIIGGVWGVVAGISMANAPVCGPGGSSYCRKSGVSTGTLVVANAVFLGTVGALFGGSIGALSTSESWKEAPLAGQR
jgi:hypothetical protein